MLAPIRKRNSTSLSIFGAETPVLRFEGLGGRTSVSYYAAITVPGLPFAIDWAIYAVVNEIRVLALSGVWTPLAAGTFTPFFGTVAGWHVDAWELTATIDPITEPLTSQPFVAEAVAFGTEG